jgi:microcystin-dependent protein
MADTFTVVLNLTLPEIGASDDTWGDKLNDNFDILDALFAATGAGTVIVRDASDELTIGGISLAKAAGLARLLKLKSGTSLRWDVGADATAEGGANAGSLFKLRRYDDAAALLGTPIIVDRASGLVTLETTPKVGANSIWHAGNDTDLRTPVGVILPYAGGTAPTNFLFCYGQSVSRTTYAALFAAIGTTYGAGDGVNTFGLPDLRGRVIAGQDDMGGTSADRLTGLSGGVDGDTLGAAGGEQSHVNTVAEMPAHDHGGATSSDGAHTHTYVDEGINSRAFAQSATNGATDGSATKTTSSNGAHTHTLTSQGGGGAHNNVQPTIILNYIIRALP